ncbi:DUF3050 domain-containing protein [Jiulongibacter sediminis]|uniref:DUF3050 domain-containing protein n=1 Tax=Jiulongibacter sediminis TaxID=1605367 RepID=UPI0026F04CEE|nr:DUF3050 domain-containing protein [Jiulongibacter sediminis]
MTPITSRIGCSGKMVQQIEKLKKVITPFQEKLIDHKVFLSIESLEDLHVFMQNHVYDVWDYMSLLKSVQFHENYTKGPWFPTELPESTYLINEVVLYKESDISFFGKRASHFELYLDAMKQSGCKTANITTFIRELKSSDDLKRAFFLAKTPLETSVFVNHTFDVINNSNIHEQAAVLTYGRAVKYPETFFSLIDSFQEKYPEKLSFFKFYLERQQNIDSELDSYLATKMLTEICQTNDTCWNQVIVATIKSLEKRLNLLNGIYRQLKKS